MNLNAPSTRRRVVPRRLKNKDIPEGGAKAVVLVDATGHGDDAWAGRGRGAFREFPRRGRQDGRPQAPPPLPLLIRVVV